MSKKTFIEVVTIWDDGEDYQYDNLLDSVISNEDGWEFSKIVPLGRNKENTGFVVMVILKK